MSQQRLLVIDGHSLAFRAYYALDASNFTTSQGMSTNAIWGFANMLSSVVNEEKPTHMAVAFDVAGGTFRNDMLPQYKGTRDAAPEDLFPQFPYIQQMLTALGIRYIEMPGYEGDDIIGTLATMGSQAGIDTLVLSGDRDAFQLIDDHVTVLFPGFHFSELKHMDRQAIIDKYKVTPEQYSDLAALRGEQADNIPGVPGVGDGFAAKWIGQYGSLAGIIEHADEIGGKKGAALRECIDQIKLNRKVNALVRDLDLGVSIDDLTLQGTNVDELNRVLHAVEFGSRARSRLLKAFPERTEFANLAEYSAAHTDSYTEQQAALHASVGDNKSASQSAIDGISDSAANSAANRASDTEQRSLHELFAVPAITVLPQTRVHKDARELVTEMPWDTWIAQHFDESYADTSLPQYPLPQRLDTADSAAAGEHVHSTESAPPEDSAQRWRHAWILQAYGTLNHMRGTLQSLTIVAPDQSIMVITAAQAEQYRDQLRALLTRFASTCATYNSKIQRHLMQQLHLDDDYMPAFDIDIAQYLVNSEFHAQNLTELVHHIFPEVEAEGAFTGTDALEPEASQGAFDFGDDALDLEAAEEQLQPLAVAQDAVAIRAVLNELMPEVIARQQLSLMQGLELPVARVLAQMEREGAAIDMQRLHDMHSRFSAEVEQAQAQAYAAVGQDVIDEIENEDPKKRKKFNLQSPKQLQTVLFDKMGLVGMRKTKRGGYSTDAQTLQELAAKYVNDERASNFLVALLRHREMNKLKQIVQTLIDEVDVRDSRIHTTYEQTVAATGRLSSTAPNLQNIPNRNMQGREIRSTFVPGDGFVSLMSADYSQVELRIMAHASGDESLIEAFQSGTDFHRYVASLVYGIAPEDISTDQRSHVKAMSYGLAYGLSTFGLAQQLQVSPAEADQLKARYFATFGKVHDYLESLVSEARKRGYTETMFGRRRYFPGLRSSNRRVRDAAERAALNAPIQGTAADIMKIAMIRAQQALDELDVRSRIILQIHDELVVEIAAGEQEQVEAAVKQAMEHAVHLAVPLDVSTGVGSDWQLAAH